MRINLSGSFSLSFGENSFLQFFSICGGSGIEVEMKPHNSFWVFVDLDDYDCRLLVFQNKSYFDDWLKAQPQKEKIKIIRIQGIIKKEN